MQKIVLMGYMASGKTSVGRLLAHQMNLRHVDLDDKIEEKCRMKIPTIFEQKGEIHFRKIERDTLVEILSDPNPIVLSLGGGTPCYANNHELLDDDNVVSVYLRASIEVIVDRLKSSGQARPLIVSENTEEIKEFVAKHLFDRSYYYNKANYTIVVDDKPPGQIAEEVLALLT